jgi:hypothetical protein
MKISIASERLLRIQRLYEFGNDKVAEVDCVKFITRSQLISNKRALDGPKECQYTVFARDYLIGANGTFIVGHRPHMNMEVIEIEP